MIESGEAARSAGRKADGSPSVDLPEVVYTPDSALRQPTRLLADMFRDLGNSRELAWRMFVRDVKADYRQSFLGYVWILLPPLASMMMFGFLQSQNILNVGRTNTPYPVYVLVGTLLWEGFAAAIGAPMKVVGEARSMLSKLNFPREALLLTALCRILFGLGIKLLLLIPVFVWFGIRISPAAILAPLGLLALVLLGFVLGLLLVPIGLLYQDIGWGLAMVLGGWFLVTPVIYPPPTAWPAVLINRLNPVSPLLITARDLLTGQAPTRGAACLAITAASVVCLFCGWLVYRVAMPHVIARMNA